MSYLADVLTFWSSSATLNAVLPRSQVFTGLYPGELPSTFPYAVLVPIGSTPTYTTGKGLYEGFQFQVSVFSDDLEDCENAAVQVMNGLDMKVVPSATGMNCIRQSYYMVVDPDSPQKVYHAAITYNLTQNVSLP